MKETRLIMGMPITVEVAEQKSPEAFCADAMEEVFSYFVSVDERFSTYKETSEISKINQSLHEQASFTKVLGGPRFPSETLRQTFAQELVRFGLSEDMLEVLALAEKTKKETAGYFDIHLPAQAGKPDGGIDPSGIVKGWAIKNAAELLKERGVENFYIEAGGDIQTSGMNAEGNEWNVGIRNPFNKNEIVKVIYPRGRGVATSGSYERGNHIYNPLAPEESLREVVSITVIGPDVLEADRFATAAFAMGQKGVEFIETLGGFEAYSIDKNGIATMTSKFLELTQ
ncbi:FAD:protein FMN transferase [Patescibacteria group bacterium]|nr:FAD:protein FMN transferase [Patescibacteria group bacterium]